jgi:DNA polymerase III epsilon subunit-like protein
MWGPWIDTMEIYKILYPQIDQYDLPYLTNLFVKEKSLEFGIQHCKKGKNSHHNALFDALCSFLLLTRIIEKVNIRRFIH